MIYDYKNTDYTYHNNLLSVKDARKMDIKDRYVETDRELFAQALCEALCKEYDDELANCNEEATVFDSHKTAMNKIFKDAGYNFVPCPEMNENNVKEAEKR